MLLRILLSALITISIPVFAQPTTMEGRVVSVYDGDTFHLLTNVPCKTKDTASLCEKGFTSYRIRMAEIDAPEHAQPYGKRSKQALSTLIFNKQARIEIETTDRYGRFVANVYVDEVWINQEMIKLGAAWVYRKYSKTPALLDYEQKAKEKGVGLWGLPENERVPPWGWRRNPSK